MGKVIMIGPVIRVRDEPSYNSGYGATTTYPVHTISVVDNDGKPLPPIQAYVSLPKPPENVERIIDPMHSLYNWFSFGQSEFGTRCTSKVRCVPMTYRISETDLRRKFWNFTEIETFVADNLQGDLMVQHCPNEGVFNFLTTFNTDYTVLMERVSQNKAVEFAMDRRFEPLIRPWLLQNVTEFDIISNRQYYNPADNIRVFIRDEDEALFFKMRWYGVDLERELEESARS